MAGFKSQCFHFLVTLHIFCFSYLCLIFKVLFWVVADIVSLHVSCLTAEHEAGPWFPLEFITVFSAVCLYFRYLRAFALLSFLVWSLLVPVPPLCVTCLVSTFIHLSVRLSQVGSPHTGIELFFWSLSCCCRILLTLCSQCLLRLASNFWPCLCFASRSEFVSSNNNPSPESCTSSVLLPCSHRFCKWLHQNLLKGSFV